MSYGNQEDNPDCPAGLDAEECDIARRADDEWRQWASQEIRSLRSNIQDIKKNTEEIVAFFNAGKGFFAVVRWLGTFAKWVSYIGAVAAATWAAMKMGGRQ